jgi:hypothetical protein
MRLVHEREGDRRTLADDVERPASALAHAKGLRFREELPEGYAFVMDVAGASPLPFAGGPTRNLVDMLFMRTPIDILWLIEGEVVATARLEPWTGFGFEKADTIVELPPGAAEGVEVGDTVRVVGEDGDGSDHAADDRGESGAGESGADAGPPGTAARP